MRKYQIKPEPQGPSDDACYALFVVMTLIGCLVLVACRGMA